MFRCCRRRVSVRDVGTQTEEIPEPEEDPLPELPAAPLVVASPRGKRVYYVVFATPAGYQHLLGIHQAFWREFSIHLPRGELLGSGVRDCKRFLVRDEAIAYFWRRVDRRAVTTVVAPLHVHG